MSRIGTARKSAVFRFSGKGTVRAGGIICLLFVLLALLAPAIAPYDPFDQDLAGSLSSPSKNHLLGQDKLGRDILSRIIYGARVSLTAGILAVAFSLMSGIFLGAISAYFGGVVDTVIMRIADIFLAFPGILLAIGMTAALGPGLRNVIIALSIIGWVGYARIVRGQILKLRDAEFAVAAKASGLPSLKILIRHLLPNSLSPIIIEATFGVARVIVAEASLSFLGLGVQPPFPSWGAMINEGRFYLFVAPHLTTIPGLAIMLLVISINFIGDGLRDTLDIRTEEGAIF
ncbi:MAG: ABC transporter permease subunit [Deltaproteobacteria bacterium]|nr:ABC transporter permease subunit [Deltaproteobacteria bacterium]NIS77429.1 ABC transporter permease subunit [Deltaproteobacteria bacterium]